MTKSTITSQPSRPIRRTARISVKPVYSHTTINLSSSSSDEFSSPIKNEHFLNLASPSPSPKGPNELTTPPPTKSPIDPTPPSAPIQTSKTPSPPLHPKLEPLELFGSPPTSPHPYIGNLNDLPPRSFNPPPFQPLDHIDQTTKPRPVFEPNEPLELNQPPQPQNNNSKPLLFHPIFKDIHGPLYGEPNFENHIQPTPPLSQPQTFKSLFPSFEEIQSMLEDQLHQAMEFQTTLLDSIPNPSSNQETTTNPPPPPSSNNSFPPTHHHPCSQCEQMVKISESIKMMLHQFQDETRFAIQHILERLDALSHPNKS